MRGNIDERGKKLFIGGLHLKTTEDSLKAFYSQWGDLIDVVVMRDPHTGKSRGFGFVTYNDPASVDIAQSNRPHEIDGIKVDAKRAMPKEDTSPEFHATVNRLFVGRLKRTVGAEELRQYFGQYGTIADAVIINSPAGESRGFGFVTFEDPDSVDKIIVSRPHEMEGQVLEVKKALPRDDGHKNSGNRGQQQQNVAGGNKFTPRGGYSSNVTPRGGGYSNNSSMQNNSFNPRFKDDSNDNTNNSYGNNFPGGNYRSQFNANSGPPYSQNYNNNNSGGNTGSVPPYQQNYSTNPNMPPYSQNFNTPLNSNSSKVGAAGMMNPTYSDPQFESTGYGQQQLPFDSEPDYNSYGGGVGQYGAPQSAAPARPYGYPPYGGVGGGGGGSVAGGGMGDYGNQKPAGGPMRGGLGATSSFQGRGGGQPRYGAYPY